MIRYWKPKISLYCIVVVEVVFLLFRPLNIAKSQNQEVPDEASSVADDKKGTSSDIEDDETVVDSPTPNVEISEKVDQTRSESQPEEGMSEGVKGLSELEPFAPSEEDADIEVETEKEYNSIEVEVGEVERREEIVVTGTRIKRSSYSMSAPVQVVDKQALERTGTSTVLEFVRELSVVPGGTSLGTADIDAGTSAGSFAPINLRGLGASATLILLNGRRMIPSTDFEGNTAVDISSFPIALIERIEILTGGASAIYGTDAIGGVVNIITRRDLDTIRIITTGEIDQKLFKSRNYSAGTVSLAMGASSDTSSFTGAIQIQAMNPLWADQRDWTKGRAYNNRFANPSTYLVNLLSLKPDPACDPNYDFTPNDGIPINKADKAPNTYVELNTYTDLGGPGQFCVFKDREYSLLSAEGSRIFAFGAGDHDLTEHTEGYMEMYYSRIAGTSHSWATLPTVPPESVLLVGNILESVPPHSDYPTDVYGPAAVVVPLGQLIGAGYPPMDISLKMDTFRFVIGTRGDLEGVAEETLLEDWEWDMSTMWGGNRLQPHLHDVLLDSALDAMDSSPGGPCASEDPKTRSEQGCFNPWYSSVLAAQDIENGLEPRATYNTEETLNRLIGSRDSIADTSLWTNNAGLSGSMFEIPGGDAQVAFGFQHRYETRKRHSDEDTQQGNYVAIFASRDSEQDRHVLGSYLEFLFPIVKPIEFELAGRLEKYQGYKDIVLSPRAGMVFLMGQLFNEPHEAIQNLHLRTIWSNSFRIADLVMLDPKTRMTSLEQSYKDDGTLSINRLIISGNPNLDPETAWSWNLGLEWIWEGLFTSLDYWYIAYDDKIVLRTAQDIMRCYELSQGLLGPDVDTKRLNRECLGLEELVAKFEPPAPTTATVYTTYMNATELFTDGFDLRFFYKWSLTDWDIDLDIGEFFFGGNGTYIFGYHLTESAMGDTVDRVGSRNSKNSAPTLPQWRAQATVGWSLSNHTLAFISNMISGYEDDSEPLNRFGQTYAEWQKTCLKGGSNGTAERRFNPVRESELASDDISDGAISVKEAQTQVDAGIRPKQCMENTMVVVPNKYGQVPAHFVFDVNYMYDFTDILDTEFKFMLGVRNIFNTHPKIVNGYPGFDANIYDVLGRVFYTRMEMAF